MNIVKAVLNGFNVECGPLCKSRDSLGLYVETEAAFRRIMELTERSASKWNPAFLNLDDISLDHPNLPAVLRIIKKETGKLPIPHRMTRYSVNEYKKFYRLRVIRKYEETDLCDLPYVVVRCSREIASSQDQNQTEDERYLVKADKRLKARWEYGRLWALHGYAMTTRLKDILEEQGMKGFRPRPVLFDHPEKAAKELWQPWSDVIMPRCLLPLVDNDGEPTTPDRLEDPIEYKDRPRYAGKGVHYDAGPYVPEELCYSAAEVAELGDFDIAIACERVGVAKDVAFRPLIISQRFRQALKKEKLSGMQYSPVRLLKKGDPLWENPFESMVGPYDEKPPVADR